MDRIIFKILSYTIFYKKFRYIKLNKLLKVINDNYVVVEYISSKKENINHFPNALQIYKTHYQNTEHYINKNKIIIINNGKIESRYYYKFLSSHGYQCYILVYE